jgi:hypothetical protein
MPDKDDFGSSELHKTIPGGERVLIRRMRPDDMALYRDFLRDVSAEDLRLRFFACIAELSAAEIDKLSHLDYRHEMAQNLGGGARRGAASFRFGMGIKPSRWASFLAALRARRIASAFSRVLRSDGFSYALRRFISRKRPSRCSFFLRTLRA